MGGLELLGLVAFGVVAALGGVAALVGRARDRRNQVVPGVPTTAPAAWAGSHVPEARLHRRLRAAVEAAAAAAPDARSPLSAPRRAIEEEALAIDERLVAVAAVPERERGPLLAEVRSQVSALEQAAAELARGRLDVAAARAGVEDALTRVRLLADARDEVERLDRPPGVVPGGPTAATERPGPDEPRAQGHGSA